METAIFTGIVMALVEVIKITTEVKPRYIPVIALGIGISMYAVAVLTGEAVLDFNSVATALLAVFSAIGIYSGVKNTIKG